MVPSHQTPSDGELLEWATFRLRKQADDDYRGAVDSFLVKYEEIERPVPVKVIGFHQDFLRSNALSFNC
jgi:hypothetical protein